MKKIIDAYNTVLHILGKEKSSDSGYRMIKYCIFHTVDEGVLLFHLLTREMILLESEEYERCLELSYLREKWFVIPNELDEKEYTDLVRWTLRNRPQKEKKTLGYTILTTTDCNARCYYCYEKGYTKKNMSEETAHKTAVFIRKNSGGEHVSISWFGGEPLYNDKAIDRICTDLQSEGVGYTSSMISNGYLFDKKRIEKAVKLWNLKRVQITLDGTESVYNRSKAYIYRDGSAYQVVLHNIEQLLEAGISVCIRMNMDLYNANDLLALTDELAERFQGKKKLSAYSYLIFEDNRSLSDRYTREELEQLYGVKRQLEIKLVQYGLNEENKRGLNRKLKVVHCMADNRKSVVITPDGHLSLCEHYAESELIGHIDSEERDWKRIISWREYREELSECRECFYYPECVNLKKCPSEHACSKQERDVILRKTKRTMVAEYQYWKKRQEGDRNGTVL